MLTDFQIRNAKQSNSDWKLNDGSGLHLLVRPNGSKLWRLDFSFSGKRNTLSLGAYPEVSGVEARRLRDEAKAKIKAGINPAHERRVEKLTKITTNAATFVVIARELIEKKRREGKAASTLVKIEWLIGLALPLIGSRPISEIKAAEVLAALKKAENRGKIETAHRLRAVIGEVFRYAIATARAENDPTFALRGALQAPQVKHRAAILDPKGVGELLRAIDSYDSLDIRAALRLLILNMTRPSELRLAQWSEIDFEKAVWCIPAGRMKMRQEHRVPLSRQAIEILKGRQTLSGGAALVFPSYRGKDRPMSEATMNAALKRLGYASDQVQPHGFRTIASSLLNESGKFSPDAIERALSHKDKDKIRGTYSRGSYWEERVRMAQYWADYLDTLRTGAKVIPFNGAATV